MVHSGSCAGNSLHQGKGGVAPSTAVLWQLPAGAMPVYSMIVGSLVGEPIAEYQQQEDCRVGTF